MRKALLPLLFIGLIVGNLSLLAQSSCTPDPTVIAAGMPGIYPDPSQGGMPDGEVGIAYMQIFTLVVPADTMVNVPGLGLVNATVDNVVITSVDGLPGGLSYSCDIAACDWPGGTNGCLEISGIPTEAGAFTVDFHFTANVTASGFSVPIADVFPASYSLTINDTALILVQSIAKNGMNLTQNAPNPFVDITTVSYTVPNSGIVEFAVLDMLGNQVHHRFLSSKVGKNLIAFNQGDLTSGIYFYSLSNGTTTLTNRMVVGE